MTPELARFIANTRVAFQHFSDEQLYQLAVSLRHELARRGRDCTPEADALVATLLAHARTEHRAIFSQDCETERVGDFIVARGYYSRAHPIDRAPAES